MAMMLAFMGSVVWPDSRSVPAYTCVTVKGMSPGSITRRYCRAKPSVAAASVGAVPAAM